jgi:AraC-like DNA-binding protein
MLHEARAARVELQPFVKCIWRLRGSPEEIEPQPIVPDGCFELIVHLGDPFVEQPPPPQPGMGHEVYARAASTTRSRARTQDRALLAATMRRTVVVAASGEVDVVGVRFHPARAYPFLTAAPVEVVDMVAPALEVMAPELASLSSLDPAPTEALFSTIENALAARLGSTGNDARFDRLADAFLIAAENARVTEFASAAGMSLRQFERLFKSRAGVSAKTLQRVVRFHRTAKRLLDSGAPDLATLALDGGFFDQAHMSNEFRALAEVSPSHYPRRAGALDRLFAAS